MKVTNDMVINYYNYITLKNDYDGFLKKYDDFKLKEFIKYVRTVDFPFICLFKFDKPKLKWQKSMIAKDRKTLIGGYIHVYETSPLSCCCIPRGKYDHSLEKIKWIDRCDRLGLDYNKCFVDDKFTEYFDMYIDACYRSHIYTSEEKRIQEERHKKINERQYTNDDLEFDMLIKGNK